MSIVAGILEREIDLVSHFIVALNDEQQSLAKGEASSLPEISLRKTTLVEQLNALEGERMAAIGHTGQRSDQVSMKTWLENNGTDLVAASNWLRLLDLAHEAKTLHELNAQLVETHLKNTAETLAILTQQASQSALYGASGQSIAGTGSRIVDSA